MESRGASEQVDAQINSTTQLEFKQAMQDFKTMFPEMDFDVIEEVLRANQGAVDATIDQLLSMTTDNLNEALRLHLEKVEEQSSGDCCKNQSPSNFPVGTKTNVVVSNSKGKWCPPFLGPLPPNFLRIEPPNQKSIAECGEDERIALFLQNEEFLSELRVNQDFMNILNQDVGKKGSAGPDVDVFKERLRSMGKLSRNKFAQLSRVFQRRKKNRSTEGILEQSTSGDSMLLGGEPLLLE